MRDQAVIEGFNRMEKMVGHDIRMLNKVVADLAIRTDTLQKILFGSRLSLIWTLVLSCISPKMLERSITKMHQVAKAKYEADMIKALADAKKAVIDPATVTNPSTIDRMQGGAPPVPKKVGIEVVHVLLIGLLFTAGVGCVPKGKYVALQNKYKADTERCVQIAIALRDDLIKKNQRLRKFNQLNPDWTLKEKEN